MRVRFSMAYELLGTKVRKWQSPAIPGGISFPCSRATSLPSIHLFDMKLSRVQERENCSLDAKCSKRIALYTLQLMRNYCRKWLQSFTPPHPGESFKVPYSFCRSFGYAIRFVYSTFLSFILSCCLSFLFFSFFYSNTNSLKRYKVTNIPNPSLLIDTDLLQNFLIFNVKRVYLHLKCEMANC